jgi:hypothetical protein
MFDSIRSSSADLRRKPLPPFSGYKRKLSKKSAQTVGKLNRTLKMEAMFLRNVWLSPNYAAFESSPPSPKTVLFMTPKRDDKIYFQSLCQTMLLAPILLETVMFHEKVPRPEGSKVYKQKTVTM